MEESVKSSRGIVYGAAEFFVEQALRKDDSLFTPDRVVWSKEFIDDLHERFISNPVHGGKSFEFKLKSQLEGAAPETVQLMAEILFVHFLIAKPSTIGGAKKREIINNVLSWSSAPVPIPDELSKALDPGIVRPGTAFNTSRPHMVRFIIMFVRKWKTLTSDEQQALLADPWAFRKLLMGIKVKRSNTQREALLHLVFPDTFESIVSRRVKLKVAENLAQFVDSPDANVDRRLVEIRQNLTERSGESFGSFYNPRIISLWKPDEERRAFMKWVKRFSLEKDFLQKYEGAFKLEIAETVQSAMEQLRLGSDWIEPLEQALKNPLLDWRVADHVKKTWLPEDPEGARDAILGLVDEDEELETRLDDFFARLPGSVVSTPGDRIGLASFLLFGVDPSAYTFYQPTPFKDGYRLAGYPGPSKAASETEVYLHAQFFLDELVVDCAARDIDVTDMLEAQSLLWMITKYSIEDLIFLNAEETREFARFRGEPVPEVEDEEAEKVESSEESQALAEPFSQLFADFSEAKWLFRLLRDVVEMLEIDGVDDGRFALSFAAGRKGTPISLIFAGWKMAAIRNLEMTVPRFQLALLAEHAEGLGLQRAFSFQQREGEPEIALFYVPIEDARPFDGELRTAFEQTMLAVAERFSNHNVSVHRRYNNAQLLEALLDPDKRKRLLLEGFAPPEALEPYRVDDALQDLFMEEEEFEKILGLLTYRQNIILQGPPGVGKTFMAKRLAYAMMTEKAPERVQMVQFHQSFSYEDFIQGYRPTDEGSFQRTNGIFFEFCDRAKVDPENDYVFIIDEINRGNLSKIFGELMMLLESDKRGQEWAMPLQYSKTGEESFYVPENVYLIGTMNTADRSLAMVDYALRRRFAFVDIKPSFESKFEAFIVEAGVEGEIAAKICRRLAAVNAMITDDQAGLGEGFCLGHSYFCPPVASVYGGKWYRRVIDYEIRPLLQEYWFDAPERAQRAVEVLLEGE